MRLLVQWGLLAPVWLRRVLRAPDNSARKAPVVLQVQPTQSIRVIQWDLCRQWNQWARWVQMVPAHPWVRACYRQVLESRMDPWAQWG